MTRKPAVIFLMGPTASGKTEIAVQLVKDLPCEIISVDSAMVYRGMDIGTAKPGKDILEIAPHRLIDICDPIESYSAAQFSEDARAEINEIVTRGKIPLLVGGTFLYFRALREGLSELPEADPEIREALEKEAQQHGWTALHQRLQRVDPESAQRIHPNDPQRIQRALEIYELTGEAMTSIIAKDKQHEFPFEVEKIILAPGDRARLHDKIAKRFNKMITDGLVDEVQSLFNRGDLQVDLPSMRSVGYRQVWQYLSGELGREEMIQRGIIATRQYAKRQFTWLRSDKEGEWFDSQDPEIYRKILKKLLKNPNLETTI